MPLGVVVERREIDHAWASVSWRAVAVIPGAGPVDAPRPLGSWPGGTRFHAATLPLDLYRGETEGYRLNLADQNPRVYVVMRLDDDVDAGDGDESRPRPELVTVCPFEAQDYLDANGDDLVDTVPMPLPVAVWVRDFVDRHHVDVPFKKRKRKRWHGDDPAPPRRVGG